MENKLQNRGQKLAFLSNLANGKTSLADIQPGQVEFWQRFKGKVWENELTGETLTNAQLEARKVEATKNNTLLFLTSLTAKV
jgi:hypothetical protein